MVRKRQVFASCSFDSLGLHLSLCDELREKMGFEVPTLVQAEVIPVALSGRNVLVNAETGTGKTIAYLAPIVHHLISHSSRIDRSDGTFALLLVPTRELCMQVYEILRKLLHRFHWIVPGHVMGGENRMKEKARLRKGISILVATPGRLLDHLRNTSCFSHRNLRWVVFDEADRILELGFGNDIEEILTVLGSREKGAHAAFERQNVLLSATLNEKVNRLAKISLEDPVMVGLPDSTTKHEGEMANADYNLPVQLLQRYVKVPCGCRLAALLLVLKRQSGTGKTAVFFSTCDGVDFHHALLKEFEWGEEGEGIRRRLLRLHGNMKQEERRETVEAFRAGEDGVLLCTDVAARGLDIPKVRCIIQYDCPGEATEYVHRVGRTARLGHRGDSLLFLQPVETDYLRHLENHGVVLSQYPLLLKASIESHPALNSLQTAVESFVSSKERMRKLGKKGFCSWVRAYAAHKGELKNIFSVRRLHLGHVAKTFGLRDRPSLVGKEFLKNKRKTTLHHRPNKRIKQSF